LPLGPETGDRLPRIQARHDERRTPRHSAASTAGYGRPIAFAPFRLGSCWSLDWEIVDRRFPQRPLRSANSSSLTKRKCSPRRLFTADSLQSCVPLIMPSRRAALIDLKSHVIHFFLGRDKTCPNDSGCWPP
jgi:hypothetical protein